MAAGERDYPHRWSRGTCRAPQDLALMGDAAAGGPLATYARALRRHSWIVLLVMVLTIGSSVAWLSIRSPTYEASAEILVTPLPQDEADFFGIQPLPDPFETTRTLQTAAGLLRSNQAAVATAQQVGQGYTGRRVLDAVKSEPRGESNLVAITATADTPALAAQLANTFSAATLKIRGDAFQANLARRITELRRQGISVVRQAERSSESSALRQAAVDISQRINRLRELRGGGDPTLRQSASAQLPTAVTGAPKWLIVVLAAVFGLALGSGAALLRDAVDRRITEDQEVLAIYPLPVLGHLAVGKGDRHVAQNREVFRTLALRLAGYAQKHGTEAEPVSAGVGVRMAPAPARTRRRRRLASSGSAFGPPRGTPRRKLVLGTPGTEVRAVPASSADDGGVANNDGLAALVLVTSASSQDGKTRCATELARALAATGQRVILMDLDLRKPDCASALGVTVPPSRTLLHGETLDETLVEVPALPSLRLVVGGQADDEAQLVSFSRGVGEVVHALRQRTDFVVVDTAPMGRVGDALQVALSADEILLVARLGNTDREALVRVRDLLEQSGLGASGLLLLEPMAAAQLDGYASYGVDV